MSKTLDEWNNCGYSLKPNAVPVSMNAEGKALYSVKDVVNNRDSFKRNQRWEN